jgi:hypothetical protein
MYVLNTEQSSEQSNLSPEEGNSATKMLAAVKDSMKEICLHEMIASSSDKSVPQPQMCAKVAVDKVCTLCMYESIRTLRCSVCTCE